MNQIKESDFVQLEQLRRKLVFIGDVKVSTEPDLANVSESQISEVIYQSTTEPLALTQENGTELGRLVLYWDLKDPDKADKFGGYMPGDYLFIFPIRKDEVNDAQIHGILNNMKGRMHYICSQKLGYDHAVTFLPTSYYPQYEALVVRVEPEETIISPEHAQGL